MVENNTVSDRLVFNFSGAQFATALRRLSKWIDAELERLKDKHRNEKTPEIERKIHSLEVDRFDAKILTKCANTRKNHTWSLNLHQLRWLYRFEATGSATTALARINTNDRD